MFLLIALLCGIMAFERWLKHQKKEAFLANPERAMAEIEYERMKREQQQTVANIGLGALRLVLGK